MRPCRALAVPKPSQQQGHLCGSGEGNWSERVAICPSQLHNLHLHAEAGLPGSCMLRLLYLV